VPVINSGIISIKVSLYLVPFLNAFVVTVYLIFFYFSLIV